MKSYTYVVSLALLFCLQMGTVQGSTGPERLTSRSSNRAMRSGLVEERPMFLAPRPIPMYRTSTVRPMNPLNHPVNTYALFIQVVAKFNTVIVEQSILNHVSSEEAVRLRLHVQSAVQSLDATIFDDDKIKYTAATVSAIIKLTGNNFNFVKSVQDLKRAAESLAADYRIQ